MMYTLRDYQREASDRAVEFFKTKNRKNGLIVLPTGSGKSLVIADIAHKMGAPVLVLQPSKEILEQNYKKFISYSTLTSAGIYSASANRREIERVTFATIGSIINKVDAFRKFRYLIIDECHLVNPKEGMYKEFIEGSKCRVLGLTATPYRLASNIFGSMLRFITRTKPRIFNELIYYVQTSELAKRGYLAKMQYYQMKILDTSQLRVNSTGAEYTDSSIRELFHKTKFSDSLEDIIKRLLIAGRTSILVFTRFIEEAEALAKSIGDRAAIVTGDTAKREREEILQDFKKKKIAVVANVGVLTTGFDYPELDTVVIARPTMSLSLWYQMVGRAIRPHPGKESWIIDPCGNYSRFGKVENLEIRETTPGLYAVFTGKKQLTNVYY